MNRKNRLRWFGGFLTAVTAVLALVLTAGFAQAASGTLNLHNNTAQAGEDCPDTEGAYWHFVLAPNAGNSFGTITLNIGGDSFDFDAPADLDSPVPATEWIPNGYPDGQRVRAGPGRLRARRPPPDR